MLHLWYKEAIADALDVESIFDSNGDGVGEFRGQKQPLDALAERRLYCGWLLPYYAAPTATMASTSLTVPRSFSGWACRIAFSSKDRGERQHAPIDHARYIGLEPYRDRRNRVCAPGLKSS